MIGRLAGTLLARNPPTCLIDVAGVGYELEMPLSAIVDLPSVGEPAVVFVHHHIWSEGQALYGFIRESDRGLFRELIKVSGIGAKLALNIMSGVSANDLVTLVQAEDAQALTKLPGIGKKTAQRLIVEMRDRLKLGPAETIGAGGAAAGSPEAEATGALVALGYKPQEVQRMVRKVTEPGMDAEAIIRAALKTVVKT